jgi:hypothetical protein
MRRCTLGIAFLALALPSVANAAPPPSEPSSEAPSPAASSDPPRPAEHNSLRGSLGLFHTALADVGDPYQLRFRTHFDTTSRSPFLVDDAGGRDRMGRVRGTVNLGLTFTRWTEVFLAVHGASTRNARSDDAREDPETILALGDIDLGVKGAWRGVRGGALGVGGQAVLGILSGDRRLLAERVNVDLAALVTFDARYVTRKRLPIRATANVGWVLDNSSKILDLAAVQDDVSREAFRFGYGMQYSRVKTRIALDFPFRLGADGQFGLDPIVELAWDVVTAKADPAFQPVPANIPAASLPRSIAWLTAGLRANVVSGVFLDAAVDVGLVSPGYAFGPPTAPWQVAVGLGWAFDAAPPKRGCKRRSGPGAKGTCGGEGPPSERATHGAIRGRVLDAQGQPVAGARVAVLGRGDEPVASSPTGDFSLVELPAGEQELEVALPDGQRFAARVTVVGADTLEIELRAPAPLPSLPTTAIFEAAVVDASGAGVAADVRVTGNGVDEVFPTDPQGRLALELPLGTYTVEVSGAQLAAPKSAEVVIDAEPGRDVIVVDRVTVTPEPAPTVDPTPSTDPTPPPRGDGDATAVSRSGRLLKTRPPLRYDGYGVDSSASGTLDDLAAYLTAHPEIELLEIGVHTDDRGSPKARSMSRANAVVNGLTERGIARERLDARGYGDADPVAVNLTPDGRRQNNRTVLKIRGAK